MSEIAETITETVTETVTESDIHPAVIALAIVGGLVVLKKAPRIIRATNAGVKEYRRNRRDAKPKTVPVSYQPPRTNRSYFNLHVTEA